MKLGFERLGLVFNPELFVDYLGALSHAANPVAVRLSDGIYRVFFNSRDEMNRSSVYSFDFDIDGLCVLQDSLKPQYILQGEKTYYCDGISLGSEFKLNGVSWITFMGWTNPPGKQHWFGKIGKFKLNEDLNFGMIEKKPWFDLDKDDPVSLSYPTFYEDTSETKIKMWYGSTITWDAGNGEMLHLLKEKSSLNGVTFASTGRRIPWKIGFAQAFSRPSVIKVGDYFLMSYSFRGNQSRYKIGFCILNDIENFGIKSLEQFAVFGTSDEHWENDMVEYPYLVSHGGSTYMFYNGNRYGQTGIGLAKVLLVD